MTPAGGGSQLSGQRGENGGPSSWQQLADSRLLVSEANHCPWQRPAPPGTLPPEFIHRARRQAAALLRARRPAGPAACPPEMARQQAYSSMLYRLPCSTVPMSITGIILDDLASTCSSGRPGRAGGRAAGSAQGSQLVNVDRRGMCRPHHAVGVEL